MRFDGRQRPAVDMAMLPDALHAAAQTLIFIDKQGGAYCGSAAHEHARVQS